MRDGLTRAGDTKRAGARDMCFPAACPGRPERPARFSARTETAR